MGKAKRDAKPNQRQRGPFTARALWAYIADYICPKLSDIKVKGDALYMPKGLKAKGLLSPLRGPLYMPDFIGLKALAVKGESC